MPSDSNDYERTIADLEVKRAAFNAAVDMAIQQLRVIQAAFAGLSAMSGAVGMPPIHSNQTEAITPSTFFSLGIAEAAIKYLSISKTLHTSREIADALEAANYHHTSQNFVNTVNTALYRRSKDERDVIKIGKKWALAEWYPGRRRAVSLDPDDAVVEPDGEDEPEESEPEM